MKAINELYNLETVSQNFHPQELLKHLLNESNISYKRELVAKGNKLFNADQESDKIIFISSGMVTIEKENHIYGFLQADNFIGCENMLNKNNNFFDIVTFTETEVIIFKTSTFEAFLRQSQEGWLYLYTQNQRMRQCLQQSYYIRRKKGTEKVLLGLQYIKSMEEESESSPIEITYSEVSNFLGIEVNSLKKTLIELKKRGIENPFQQNEVF
ncbi:Crp/Fnr family transcriptional regulator [Listeria booriae]|uniref:Crp/Fnr family transcriptional regulator n=1 Tax=Listeria booriae TaxID=1552123 RepID=A0A7X0XRV8_9LIST|nr:Crp/Fnr family transcriptional regulator [Listeria booriae]MBC1779565.1 Crp/Fnr family transcriptional regulator [Listeria booriae]MBC1887956.1 Crp/Fnr family transcriptional regulator [Listeria booriae]